VNSNSLSEHGSPIHGKRPPHWRLRTEKAVSKGAVALTKDALSMIALLSSLGVWAAVWSAAASIAAAWLQ
jgi:hypothetical protein